MDFEDVIKGLTNDVKDVVTTLCTKMNDIETSLKVLTMAIRSNS